MEIETELIVKVNGEVIYRDSALGENGLESIVEKSYRIPQQIKNYNALKNPMNVTIDPKDAEDVAVDIAVEEAQLEKPVCKKCGSTLVDDGYGNVNACTNCA